MPLPGLSVWEVNRIVGADAHIGPAECTVFSEICGEFATSQRADVGIGPLHIRKRTRADRVRPVPVRA